MRRQHRGGQNARDWRREVAALATRQQESVFTYKFRLDCAPDDFDFGTASSAYNVTEGIGKGSLFGLVCAVHLSGFRLFSRAADTRQFRNTARYPSQRFADALKKHLGIENSRLTIQSVENVFSNPPRARDGATLGWSADTVARRLYGTWIGRAPGNDADPAALQLANGIGERLTQRYDGWKALADDVCGGLVVVDHHLATLGTDFPALSNLSPESELTPPNCTLAYDRESPFVDMANAEEIWLHQVVAVCAHRLRCDDPALDPASSSFASSLKNSIVTNQNNGLSWLFGRGLAYLRAKGCDEIAADLGVPSDAQCRIEQLKAFADALPPTNPLFKSETYAEFRGSVGGKLSSWISNYWKRLQELEKLHAQPPQISFPAALSGPNNAHLFSGQHVDAEGLKALCNRLPQRIGEAGEAVAVLLGEAEKVPALEHVTSVEEVAHEVAEVTGQVSMLQNRVEQEIERADGRNRLQELDELKPEVPTQLREPPKLNRISGGTVDAATELIRLEKQLNEAVVMRRTHFDRLATWAAEENGLDPFPAMAERERRALEDRHLNPARAEEQALRHLLNSIAAMSRRLSSATAGRVREAIVPLFVERREANLYFHNRTGSLYRHPFSTSRHQAYAIDIERAQATDWLAWMMERVSELREKLNAERADNAALLRDLLLIEEFTFTTRLGGLPERGIPAHLARPELGDLVRVPSLLAAQLSADEVGRDVAIRAFNLFNSGINGLLFRALRDSFIVRTKFQRLGCDKVFYVPKARAWVPPDTYLNAKGEIAAGLKLPEVKRDSADSIEVAATVEALSRSKFPEPGSRALLHQAPHDWYLEIDLRDRQPQAIRGLPLKKNTDGLQRWGAASNPAFRLVGPPSFKTWLDRALTHEDIKLGDYTLLLDQFYEQSLCLEGGCVRLSANPSQLRVEAAFPIIDARSLEAQGIDLLFDHIVAIDLGERRVGYAVFSLEEFLKNGGQDPIEVGSVAIPAFRRLMTAVRRHRRVRQPNQKVNQSYSKALQQFRENVVGDVCNRIDTLCERFRAFPILESSVANFETGARQLELIYGTVLRRYTYSNVAAHKSARSAYWYSANKWDHPYLFMRTWNKRRRDFSGPAKILSVYPGISVNPAGTSQTCHRCGRNAVRSIRDMPNSIEVAKNGEIVLGNGTIRLLERADYPNRELKAFRRHKERPPLNVPRKRGTRSRDDMQRILRRNMRQAPRSEMSPDTTQSRFTCMYVDCGYEGHADENAAVNIGRRFLERVAVNKSAARLRDLREKKK